MNNIYNTINKHSRIGHLELIRWYEKLIKDKDLKGGAKIRLKQLQDSYRGGNGNPY